MDDVQHPQHGYPPLPLKYIEALLLRERGLEVRLMDGWVEPFSHQAFCKEALDFSPDGAVISFTSFERQEATRLAQALKTQARAFVVAIGQDVSAQPHHFMTPASPIDVALPGEAEEETASLMVRLREGQSPQSLKEHYASLVKDVNPLLVEDLDALPFPSFSQRELNSYGCLYPLRLRKKVKWGFILTGRGCPHRCLFCSPITRKSFGEGMRLRSSENIVDEMEHLMAHGVNAFSFEDDNFTAKEAHVLSLCEEIQRRHLKVHWMARARIDGIRPHLLEAMKEAGCLLLHLGVESGSERIIRLIRKSSNNGAWPEMCKRVFHEAKRVGIATNAFFVLGCPTETREEVEQSIHLAEQLAPDMVQVHFFTPYPGSEAFEAMGGALGDEELAKMFHYTIPIVNQSLISNEELWRLRARFYKGFLFNPAFLLRHLYYYGLFYLRNPDVLFNLLGVKAIL